MTLDTKTSGLTSKPFAIPRRYPRHDPVHSNWVTEFAAAVHGVVEKAEVHFENEEELVFPLAAQLLDAVTLDCIEAEITALDRRCLQ